MAESKGLRKKHSSLQKAHYQAYRLVDRARLNLIKRLETRIRRNARLAAVKAARKPPRAVRPDVGAINRLKALTN